MLKKSRNTAARSDKQGVAQWGVWKDIYFKEEHSTGCEERLDFHITQQMGTLLSASAQDKGIA